MPEKVAATPERSDLLAKTITVIEYGVDSPLIDRHNSL